MSATQTTSSRAIAPPFRDPSGDRRQEPLRPEGWRFIVRDHIAAVIQIGLALAAARSLGWYNAWLYAAVLFSVKLSTALLLTRYNPAVMNARGTKQKLDKREKLFFSVFLPSSLAIPIVAGLDVGVAGWSHHSTVELAAGIAMLVAGTSIIVWALAVNAFFEPTVRIQADRDHRVCTSGPYRYVRHPGYVGVVLATAGVPLVLGSYWAFVPVAIAAVAFVVRTSYEDRMLHAELAGYPTYAGETRYRLFPFIW